MAEANAESGRGGRVGSDAIQSTVLTFEGVHVVRPFFQRAQLFSRVVSRDLDQTVEDMQQTEVL